MNVASVLLATALAANVLPVPIKISNNKKKKY
jgi:hypothetical protein